MAPWREIIAASVHGIVLAFAAAAQPCEWSDVGGGMNVEVYALAEFDGALYAGGAFTFAGGIPALRVARWDGQGWAPVGAPGGGLTGPFNSPDALAMAVYDDGRGGGPALYIGGTFDHAGGIEAPYVARWDGAAWSRVGAGMSTRVWALTVFDGSLYAGGSFTTLGGLLTPSRVARWNGEMWDAVGLAATGDHVRALAAFNGSLHAGRWTPSGVAPAMSVSRWDGQVWVPLGGAAGMPDGPVFALAEFDGSLYAGGQFAAAGGVTVSGIARWDGSAWSDVGGGITGGPFPQVRALAVFDDQTGGGPALFAGGLFDAAGSSSAAGVAKWNGEVWSPLGFGAPTGFNPTVHALAGFDDGSGSALYTGGSFTSIGGVSAERIARWRCDPAPPVCYANCDGSTVEPVLNVDDFTCFINEFAAAKVLPHAQQLEHYANCDGSKVAPALNVDDFTCFINAFAAGCR